LKIDFEQCNICSIKAVATSFGQTSNRRQIKTNGDLYQQNKLKLQNEYFKFTHRRRKTTVIFTNIIETRLRSCYVTCFANFASQPLLNNWSL